MPYRCNINYVLSQDQNSELSFEGFNDWGGRGYDDFVPGVVSKTASSGDRTT